MLATRRSMLSALLGAPAAALAQTIRSADGVYTGFKADNVPERTECGLGALMPWAGALWAVTYNSHLAGTGTGLGLYRIGEDLEAERVHVHDGTHANRLIHHETNQCLIGPYVIDSKGEWRFIPEFRNHRLTATMRHLSAPAEKVYYRTMEGLFFEMDLATRKPVLISDLAREMNISTRPHFKGRYTAQQRVVVSNNGFYEYGDRQAGLFEYDGKRWKRLREKPYMDVAARENMGNVLFASGCERMPAMGGEHHPLLSAPRPVRCDRSRRERRRWDRCLPRPRHRRVKVSKRSKESKGQPELSGSLKERGGRSAPAPPRFSKALSASRFCTLHLSSGPPTSCWTGRFVGSKRRDSCASCKRGGSAHENGPTTIPGRSAKGTEQCVPFDVLTKRSIQAVPFGGAFRRGPFGGAGAFRGGLVVAIVSRVPGGRLLGRASAGVPVLHMSVARARAQGWELGASRSRRARENTWDPAQMINPSRLVR